MGSVEGQSLHYVFWSRIGIQIANDKMFSVGTIESADKLAITSTASYGCG